MIWSRTGSSVSWKARLDSGACVRWCRRPCAAPRLLTGLTRGAAGARQARFMAGSRAYRIHDYVTAVREFSKAIFLDKRQAQFYAARAKAYRELGDFKVRAAVMCLACRAALVDRVLLLMLLLRALPPRCRPVVACGLPRRDEAGPGERVLPQDGVQADRHAGVRPGAGMPP